MDDLQITFNGLGEYRYMETKDGSVKVQVSLVSFLRKQSDPNESFCHCSLITDNALGSWRPLVAILYHVILLDAGTNGHSEGR